MATNAPLSPRERGEALSRLRTLTAGAAVAGVVATAGIGVFAAATTHASSTRPTPDAGTAGSPGDPAAPDPRASDAPIVTGGDDGGTTATPGPFDDTAPQANPFGIPNGAIQPPIRTGRRGHATTGGS